MSILQTPRTASGEAEWKRQVSSSLNQLISRKLLVKSVTANYTVENDYDVFKVDTTGGAVTITLPAAALHSGRVVNVKRMDGSANTLTVDGNAAETIDGSATLLIPTQYESFTLLSDGTGWIII